MTTNTLKKERIDARLTAEQKALIQRAAALEGRSVGDFVVSAATEAASELVEQRYILELSAADEAQFLEAFSQTPRMTPALRRAYQRRAERLKSR